MNTGPTLIVLAAGSGSRFHGSGHKLLQTLAATDVLSTTLGAAVAAQLQVVVVTTEALAATARQHVAARDVVILPPANPSVAGTIASVGMGHSIAAGVNASPNARGWLVVPADMPLIRPATLRAVAQALRLHPIVFAQHRGQRGHPVAFGPELYSDLIRLTGDEGARRLLGRYPSHGLEIDDPGVLVDLDTEADLHRLRHLQAA